MNYLQEIFQYEGKKIRVVIKGGQPWWAAKDVCDVLGYTNHNMILTRIDEDEKGVNSFDTLGGLQEIVTVNESGLYSLILGSKKKESKKFKRWITHEVLPQIRKTGQYKLKQPQSVEDLIILQAKSVKELKQKVDKQGEQIETLKSAVIHTDEDWRNWVNEQLNKIAFQNKNYRELRKQSYDILENRARCRLNVRLNNLRDRLRETGATETKISQANYLDVIEDSTRLKEIYTNIVEKIVIKYST